MLFGIRSAATRTVLRRGARAYSEKSVQEKAVEQAKDLTAKGKQLSQDGIAWASNTLGPRVNALAPNLRPNLSVAAAVAKHVYKAEGLSPRGLTDVGVWRGAWGETVALFQTVKARQITGKGLARAGVIGLEAYGIYKIGEIIGRRQLVGYDLH